MMTGEHVGISYLAGLALIRAAHMNVTLIVATKQSLAAAVRKRYESETDFKNWSHRVIIYEVDFQSRTNVNLFCKTIMDKYPVIDALIHNASVKLDNFNNDVNDNAIILSNTHCLST